MAVLDREQSKRVQLLLCKKLGLKPDDIKNISVHNEPGREWIEWEGCAQKEPGWFNSVLQESQDDG